MFSKRADWNPRINRLTRVREELARDGEDILDLTVSNPTQASIDYPHDELSAIMARAARAPYRPEPLGILSARSAVAEQFGCSPDDIVLTASTSEAYSHLFKLLSDPGDAILTATPSYPLLDHLAGLEQVQLHTFPLEFHRRWEIEATALRESMSIETRAIVVVNPNNPTGSYVTAAEQEAIASLGVPVISDEVFFDYPLEPVHAASSFASASSTLVFVLGGLSKSAGLPHYKLGWIRLTGPELMKKEALAGLELIADSFLSVATPVQEALPELLAAGSRIRSAISQRTASNLADLRSEVSGRNGVSVLPVEGGWSAVIRVPRTSSDEDLAVTLLEQARVAVHPGYFFDFATDGYLVVSLLTPRDVFAEGVRRILRGLPA